MRTSVLRRQGKKLRKTQDLRAVAAASTPMAPPDSPPACNLPEILARDLELSEATFLAKSMTAGAPIRTMATPIPQRQKQPSYVPAEDHNPRVHWKDSLSKQCGLGVIEETSYHSDTSDDGTAASDVASLTSDSGTESGPDMEPLAVRSAKQSSGPPATAGMNHLPPLKGRLGNALVALDDSFQGQSWIDFNMEDSDDDENAVALGTCAVQATEQVSEDIVKLEKDSQAQVPNPQGHGTLPALPPSLDRIRAALPLSSFSSGRPHTSSGVSTREKPRLVEVKRSRLARKRSYSLQTPSRVDSRSLSEYNRRPVLSWGSAATTLASQASEFQHEIIGSEAYHNSHIEKESHNQAIVSDDSTGDIAEHSPSAIHVDDQERCTQDGDFGDDPSHNHGEEEADPLNKSSIAGHGRMSGIDIPTHLSEEVVDDPVQVSARPPDLTTVQASQDVAAQDLQDPPTPAESANSGESSVVETFFRSKIALPAATSTTSRPVSGVQTSSPSDRAPVNMRLHPDVFYRLEASIKGFPDTMLSTRALPIDIIRSLPKNRSYSSSSPSSSSPSSSLTAALSQPDAAYLPPTSKWNLSLRKRNNHPPLPPPAPATLPASTGPPPTSIIQRVFPLGNVLHCDSLYAHLIAYIYVASLCGPDAFYNSTDTSCVTAPTSAMSGTPAKKSRNLMHRLSDGETAAIPRKASMLLGMDKATPTPDPTTASSPEPSTHKMSEKVRGLFRGSRARRESSEDGTQGRMVPAKPGVSGRSKPVTERDVREVQAGLLKCIRCLVAKLKTGREEGDKGLLREDDFLVDADASSMALDPYMLRALVEIVRREEERLVGGWAAV